MANGPSRHVPKGRIPSLPHPGIMGTAPSQEMLDKWNQRERKLIQTNPERVPALAMPLEPTNVMATGLKPGTAAFERIAKEGARSFPATWSLKVIPWTKTAINTLLILMWLTGGPA